MTSQLVVDASVAMKWFFDEGDSEKAVAVAECGVDLIAPSLLRTELANGLWKRHRLRMVGVDDALAIWARVPGFFSALVPVDDLMPDAIAIAFELDHPVYDCVYLALSRMVSAPLVTSDTRLINKIRLSRFAGDLVSLAAWRPQ